MLLWEKTCYAYCSVATLSAVLHITNIPVIPDIYVKGGLWDWETFLQTLIGQTLAAISTSDGQLVYTDFKS